MLREVVTVETVRPGDRIVVGKTGEHVVSRLLEYDTLGLAEQQNFVVVYFASEERTYENRARDRSGHNSRRRLVEKSVRPLLPGEPVVVERGNPLLAEQLRETMEREFVERMEDLDRRRHRAQLRDLVEKEARS